MKLVCLERIRKSTQRDSRVRLTRGRFPEDALDCGSELLEFLQTSCGSLEFLLLPDEEVFCAARHADGEMVLDPERRRRQKAQTGICVCAQKRGAISCDNSDRVFIQRQTRNPESRSRQAFQDRNLRRRQFNHSGVRHVVRDSQATAWPADSTELRSSETRISRSVAINSSRETWLLRNCTRRRKESFSG